MSSTTRDFNAGNTDAYEHPCAGRNQPCNLFATSRRSAAPARSLRVWMSLGLGSMLCNIVHHSVPASLLNVIIYLHC